MGSFMQAFDSCITSTESMQKFGKQIFIMNNQALGKALKERLAKIQVEKQKILEQLWTVEFAEQNTLEKMRRHGMFEEECDLPQADNS